MCHLVGWAMSPEPLPRVLVTGATGFLGQHLVTALKQNGWSVVAQGRNADRLQKLPTMQSLQWDIRTPPTTQAHMTLDPVQAVVHCAALSAPYGRNQAFHEANVTGTRHVLALAKQLGAKRFVHISSPSVYFAPKDQLKVAEDAPLPSPFNAYAATKALAEKEVLDATKLGPIILRPRGIYGPGDETLVPRLLRAAKARPLPVFRDGRARIDLTYVGDVVAAICAALNAGSDCEKHIFNVSGGEVLPIRDIVDQVCTRALQPVRWRRAPLGPALMMASAIERVHRALPGLGEPVVTRYALALFAYAQSLDISKARDVLGWTPKVSFTEGLERTFQEGSQW